MSIKRAPYKGIALPDEKFLIVRPCFTAICMGNKPASKLISALLFYYNPDNEQDLEKTASFEVKPSQEALIQAMCGECTSKTIHDVATPCLQLFGYLSIDETTSPITYTVHLDVIRERLQMYSCKPSELEKVLIRIATEMCPEIEDNKKKFYLSLEKVLMTNRKSSNSDGKSSNSRRGPKPKTQAAPVAKKSTPKNSKNKTKNKQEQERESERKTFSTAIADAAPSQSSFLTSEKREEVPTELPQVARDSGGVNPQEQRVGNNREAPTVTPKAKPAMPPVDAVWNTRTCIQMFDAWRGVPLMAKYKLQQASGTCKALAENYTREQVEQTYESMSNDQYWIARGGPDFDNVANNIARELKKIERGHLRVVPNNKAVQPTHPPKKEQSQEDLDAAQAAYERLMARKQQQAVAK